MKIAQQFSAFLEMHHFLQLPSLGKLEIVSTEPDINSAEFMKREFRFTADVNTITDNLLPQFISEKLKIERCIAESDLIYFCNSLKELLIQGFEAEIPGIGYLNYESNSQLKFSCKSLYSGVTNKLKKRLPAIVSSSFWL